MGLNTSVILYNDHANRWPQEIRDAMAKFEWSGANKSKSPRESGFFGYGNLIGIAHADFDQICIVGGNVGRQLNNGAPPALPGDLELLAQYLRDQGYKVTAPPQTSAS